MKLVISMGKKKLEILLNYNIIILYTKTNNSLCFGYSRIHHAYQQNQWIKMHTDTESWLKVDFEYPIELLVHF